MGTPFLSEIKLVSFVFAPRGWAFCNGQLLQINTNQALFSLLGTTYGGNGQTTFALPDLRGRVAVHWGPQFTLGARMGTETHTITVQEMPQHIHVAQANTTPGIAGVAGITPGATKALAQGLVSITGGGTTTAQIYGTAQPDRVMSPATVANAGGSQPHENRQPYLTLNYIIALQGIFPSRN